MGLRPSASQSRPVSTAITPGTASAAVLSIERITRMRVRRAHHHRVGLARQAHVVGVAASAGDEAQVLLAPHRLADAGC